MLPLLSETSLQAQVLVPMVASVVFGMLSATLLLLLVLPAAYAILEDFGFTEIEEDEPQLDIEVLSEAIPETVPTAVTEKPQVS
jgi:hypothetical protein